jgi:putative acetyltransferase
MSRVTSVAGHTIRRMEAADRGSLLALWERSVRATHLFLGEDDIAFYRPLVAQILVEQLCELWVLVDPRGIPIGFLGLSAHAIDALFLDPAYRSRGWGRLLVSHAQAITRGALTVTVNEQNTAACSFYAALGFEPVRRSPIDEFGRPFALLHLHRKAPVCNGPSGLTRMRHAAAGIVAAAVESVGREDDGELLKDGDLGEAGPDLASGT